MDNIKNDEYYISKIKEHLNFICNHMSKIDKDDFSKDEILQKAMSFSLVQISECSKNLSDEYKTNHNQSKFIFFLIFLFNSMFFMDARFYYTLSTFLCINNITNS